MIKVFLVDDDGDARAELRDGIQWQQHGYQFAGEAEDGEMALPLIRKAKPDVLVTDIRMPFMDGLALAEVVRQEFPKIKIIILSAHAEFEYAKRAIRVGVEQYLTKPASSPSILRALQEVREKIEREREREDSLEKVRQDLLEYGQFAKRIFFEKIFEGQLSVREIYEQAQELSLEIDAAGYNLAMVSLWERKAADLESTGQAGNSRLVAAKREELLRYFQRYPEYLPFRWTLNTYGILIKGEEAQMEELREKCVENIARICSGHDGEMDWCCAAGQPVGRLSLLPQVYEKVNRVLSYRFLRPGEHILNIEDVGGIFGSADERCLDCADIGKADPEIVREFLMRGRADEVDGFVEQFLGNQEEALQYQRFCDYLVLSVRFTAISFMEKLGYSQEELLRDTSEGEMWDFAMSRRDMETYLRGLLRRAIELRDKAAESRSGRMMKKAVSYIEENFSKETLSLHEVSDAAEVSANYFSAAFRQEMGMTFTEFVTQKRMEKAKQLLAQTRKPSGDIAAEVGYKDPHYFSFVFRKTQGCTPREYRNGAKD